MLAGWLFLGTTLALVVVVVIGWAWSALRHTSRDKLVRVWTAAGEAEAHVNAQHLQSAGVRVIVKNVGDGYYYTSPSAYELWVPRSQIAEARRVLGLG